MEPLVVHYVSHINIGLSQFYYFICVLLYQYYTVFISVAL